MSKNMRSLNHISVLSYKFTIYMNGYISQHMCILHDPYILNSSHGSEEEQVY